MYLQVHNVHQKGHNQVSFPPRTTFKGICTIHAKVQRILIISNIIYAEIVHNLRITPKTLQSNTHCFTA